MNLITLLLHYILEVKTAGYLKMSSEKCILSSSGSKVTVFFKGFAESILRLLLMAKEDKRRITP